MSKKVFDPKNNYEDYLELIRRIFEKRLKEKLSDERVENIAQALMRFGGVCHNFQSRKQGNKPIYPLEVI